METNNAEPTDKKGRGGWSMDSIALAAAQQPNQPYPFRYDDFADTAALVEYLRSLGVAATRMSVSNITHMPLVARSVDGFRYQSVRVHTIYLLPEPPEHKQRWSPTRDPLLGLRPERWSLDELEAAIGIVRLAQTLGELVETTHSPRMHYD